MRRLILLGCLTVLGGTPGASQSHTGMDYEVYGPGTYECAEWTRDRANNDSNALLQESWLAGYVSGVNALWKVDSRKGSLSSHPVGKSPYADVLAGTNLTAVEHNIDHYCLDHPHVSLVEAADSVVTDATTANEDAEIRALLKAAGSDTPSSTH